MPVIDIDPEVLRRDSELAAHASEQSNVHIASESTDDIPYILTTLVKDGPYAFSAGSTADETGKPKLRIATTRDGVREGYEMIHAKSYLATWVPLNEVRGEWYTFHEGVSRSYQKPSGELSARSSNGSIALFPNTSKTGITGELVWSRIAPNKLGVGFDPNAEAGDPSVAREALIGQHERYLEGLRSGDVKGIMDVMHDDVATAMRDYVNDTGTLTDFNSKSDLESFYVSFFDKYEIVSVQNLRRLTQDWYLFYEARITVRERGGNGSTLAYNVAEYFVPAHDGRFVVRIGHGTDAV